MVASLSFEKQDGTKAIDLAEIKTIVYKDNTDNKYTFGVDNANVFNTFRYKPNGADPEVDYSATAIKFMTGGAIRTLLDIGTNVGEIKTKTDNMPDNLVTELGTLAKTAELAPLVAPLAKTAELAPLVAPLAKTADVAAIKAKTDNMPDNLVTELGTLAKTAELAPLVAPLAKTADVAAIKAKTDNMPDNLVTELGTLAKTAELAPLVAPLAKTAELAPLVAPLAKTADVAAIKAKTDNMPDNLVTELGTLAKTAELAPLVAPLAKTADVAAIKAKTDNMPDNLVTELGQLTAIGNAINDNGNVTQAAKVVLESSFKKAIEKAGENDSDWLENRVADIVSQAKFDIPASDDAALNWTW